MSKDHQIIDGFKIVPSSKGVDEYYWSANRNLQYYGGALNVVVDLGAHIGSLSLLAARKGAKLVLAYEPNPICFHALVANILINGYWGTILPVGLAVVGEGCGGQREFWLPGKEENSGTASLISPTSDTPMAVWTQSLRSIIESVGVVDYLKIDVEGAEYELLPRDDITKKMLGRVRYLDLEVHGLYDQCNTNTFATYSKNGNIYDEIKDFVKECGFTGTAHPKVLAEHGSNAVASRNHKFIE